MEECKWNFKIFNNYIRYTKSNKFIILAKRKGQWIEIFKLKL
jgi:hypothetical protein